MKSGIAAIAILLAGTSAASMAQLERREKIGSGEIGPRVPIDPSIRPMVRLATNSFGAYISEINGYPGRPVLRRGIRLVLVGRGFGPRHANSFVFFSYPGASGGPNDPMPTLDIRSWSDTRIVAELPLSRPGPSYDGPVTLKVSGVRPDNFLTELSLPNVRFVPG